MRIAVCHLYVDLCRSSTTPTIKGEDWKKTTGSLNTASVRLDIPISWTLEKGWICGQQGIYQFFLVNLFHSNRNFIFTSLIYVYYSRGKIHKSSFTYVSIVIHHSDCLISLYCFQPNFTNCFRSLGFISLFNIAIVYDLLWYQSV